MGGKLTWVGDGNSWMRTQGFLLLLLLGLLLGAFGKATKKDVVLAMLQDDRLDYNITLPLTATVAVETQPRHGVITALENPTDPLLRVFRYIPNPGFTGEETFSLRGKPSLWKKRDQLLIPETNSVCGENGDKCTTTIVSVNVVPAVWAEDDHVVTRQNMHADIAVLVNDRGTLAPTTVRISFAPEHGTATALRNGQIMYTPHVSSLEM